MSNHTNRILFFSAPWCGPCKRIHNEHGEELKQYSDRLRILDATEEPRLCKRYGITLVPSIVITDDDGKELARFVGAWPGIKKIKSFMDHRGKEKRNESINQNESENVRDQGDEAGRSGAYETEGAD